MPAEVGNDALNKLSSLMAFLDKLAEKDATWKAELEQKRLTSQDWNQMVNALSAITKNGTIMPEILQFDKSQVGFVEYLKEHLDENQFIVNDYDNSSNFIQIMTSPEVSMQIASLQIDYAIQAPEHSGYIREVSLENFKKTLSDHDNNELVVLKNLTEAQYLELARKSYNTKDAFSFVSTTTLNEAGELKYHIAVNNKNYISASKMAGKDDMYSSLIVQKAFENPERDAANIYEKNLEEKIFNYTGSEPFYVAQFSTEGTFLKVEANKITVMDKDETVRVINKVPGHERDFIIDAYRYYDTMSQPVEITQEIIKDCIRDKDLEGYLREHSRTGREKDLMLLDNNRNFVNPRPLKRNDAYFDSLKYQNMTIQYLKSLEITAKEKEIAPTIDKSTKALLAKNQMLVSLGFSPEEMNQLAETYSKALYNELAKHDLSAVGTNLDVTRNIQQRALEVACVKLANATEDKNFKEHLNLIKDNSKNLDYETNLSTPKGSFEKKLDEIAKKSINQLREIKDNYLEFENKLCSEYRADHPEFKLKNNTEILQTEDFQESVKDKKTKWFEETKQYYKLADDDKTIITAYAKDVVFKEYDGDLENIPDRLDTAIADFKTIEVEHVNLDHNGRCVELNKSLESIMDYNKANLDIDERITNINIARAENRSNDKTFRTDSIEEVDHLFTREDR